MRKKPSGKLVATAHMIEREFRVMKALKTVNFPVRCPPPAPRD